MPWFKNRANGTQRRSLEFRSSSISFKSLTGWFGGFEVVSSADLLDQLLVVLSIERHGSVNQGVQQDAQRPAVHLRSSVRPAVHDLGRSVQRTAAERLQEFIVLVEV